MGEDLSSLATMVPPPVAEALRRKRAERHPLLERLRADQEE